MPKQISTINEVRLENMRCMKNQMLDVLCACNPFDKVRIASIRSNLAELQQGIRGQEEIVRNERDMAMRLV